MFVRTDGARTRLAANRYEALIVQLVVGDVVPLYVVPHLLRGPVGEWIELDERVVVGRERLILLFERHVDTSHILIFALPGDPGIEGVELTPEWLDLALVYTLVNFTGTIAVCRFSRFGSLADRRRDEYTPDDSVGLEETK